MAFKLKSVSIDKLVNPLGSIPVYHVPEEDGTLGRALLNGCITINENIDPEQEEETISHEKVHADQIKQGDLSYTDTNIIWKGKKYSRKYDKSSPWEKEAYAKEKKG